MEVRDVDMPREKKSINRNYCSVSGCKSRTNKNLTISFHHFPRPNERFVNKYNNIFCKLEKVDLFKLWEKSLKIKNITESTTVCSLHFRKSDFHIAGLQAGNRILKINAIPSLNLPIDKKKTISYDPLNPSCTPKIFPPTYRNKTMNEASKIKRHACFMEQRIKIEFPESTRMNEQELSPVETVMIKTEEDMNYETEKDESIKYADKGCQAEIFFNCFQSHKTFTCNRFIGNIYSDVEIQTEIAEYKGPVIIPNNRKFKDKKCGTTKKTYEDKAVGPTTEDKLVSAQYFTGFSSVKRTQQLLDLSGVTVNNFNILLNKLTKSVGGNCKTSKEDKLFIVLIKIKSGMTFSAISVLFCVDRATVSRIFCSTLQELTAATTNLIVWPDQEVVRKTMPHCFYPDYSDTRVIIYCTEFKIEVVATVDNRSTYSHHKKGFTAKVLIGVTPGGLISFKSKVVGGRISDSQVTIESGLLDLLEDGDKVLADKDYPQIQQSMNTTGKNLLLVVPVLHCKKQRDKEESEATRSAAKVRMHVVKFKQHLKSFKILNKIPTNLFHYVDNILHMCCVLVNLQAPVVIDNVKAEKNDK